MECLTDSANKKALLINKELIREYYDACRDSMFGEYESMKAFACSHPCEYKRFNAVHRKRTRINNCIEAMRNISPEIYFGTLTFNNAKDKNKITSKRKEAFMKMNTLFDCVLMVEEYGERNRRYHIHFLGTFKEGKNFESFLKVWRHSRQNLRLLQDNEKVSQYLCKYLSKDLQRVRCNKRLVALEKAVKQGKIMERDKFYSLGVAYQVQKVNKISVFDLEE